MEVRASTPRRLLALVRGLPQNAATWREDQPSWSQQDELAAKAVEALEHWGPLMLMAWGAKKLPQPTRLFEHPDRHDPEQEKREVTSDRTQIARFFNRMAGGR